MRARPGRATADDSPARGDRPGDAIGLNANWAIKVRAQHLDAGTLEGLDGDRSGMAICIVSSHADEAHSGMQRVHEWLAGSRVGTVVGHLQYVDWAEQRSRGQERFDGRLRIARQERGECADLQQPHHGRVVDIALGQRAGGVGAAWVPDLEGRPLVQVEALTCAGKVVRGPGLGPRQLEEPIVGRVLIGAARVQDGRHSEPP